MKITRKEVINLHNTLSGFKGTYNKTFSMYLILNNKKLIPVIQEIQEISKLSIPSEEYMNLQKLELEIVNKYVDKDENGKSVSVGENGFKIREDSIEVYKTEKEKFLEDNKSIIDEFEALKENVEKLINEEIEVDFILIPFSCIPEEINVTELETLSTIVQDFGKSA